MMGRLAANSDFIHFVLTLAGWAGAYIALLVISRFIIVKKNALERASSTLSKVRAILDGVGARCSEGGLMDAEEAIKRLRKAKKLLLRADKMVSIYQYDHSDIMDLGSLRSSIMSLVASSEGLAVAIQKNDSPKSLKLIEKLGKTTNETIVAIDAIESAQSKVTLI